MINAIVKEDRVPFQEIAFGAGVPESDTEVRRVATSLADSLARVLASAIGELGSQRASADQAIQVSLRHYQERLDGAEKAIAGLKKSLEEARLQQQSELGRLREQSQELAESMSHGLDALWAQVKVQQEDLTRVHSAALEINPKVEALVERLNRQADAIRSVSESNGPSRLALQQLAQVLSRLSAAPAGELTESQL